MPMPDVIGPLAEEYLQIAREKERIDKNYNSLDELESSYFHKEKI